MSNAKKIVADFGTCKKAWDMGLRIIDIEYKFRTVFAWWRCLHDYETEIVQQSEWDSEAKMFYHKMYPAPTAEEVPLPEQIYYNDRHFKLISWFGLKATGYENFNDNLDFIAFSHNPNEATSRLQMAIWLIENVEEAKRWYVDNGFFCGDKK